jgi:hypothetical protein
MNEIHATQGEPAGADRKPYRKPEILSRERLEALAVVCSPPSKIDVISCPNGQITS